MSKWLPRVEAKLHDAYTRCLIAHDQTRGPFVPFVWLAADRAEQIQHGTTDYALAAWLAWGHDRGRPIRRASGVPDYRVPDPITGERKIEYPALVLDAEDGNALALTGCTWGYGGEGPHGTAHVLADAGFFPTLAGALEWVVRLDGAAGWERARE